MDPHRLQILRWMGVMVPTLGLALLTYAAHSYLEAFLPSAAIVGLTVGLIMTSAFIFSRFIFSQIEKSEWELYQRNRELAALHAVSEALSRSLELDEILSHALESVVEIVEAQAARLFLLDETNGDLSLIRTAAPSGRPKIDSTLPDMELPQQVVTSGQALLFHSPSHPVAPASLPASTGLLTTESLAYVCAYVPLRARDRVVGVLAVINHPTRLTQADLRLLTAIGNQLGLAIANARQYELIQRLVITDDLTGAHNRRYLNDLLARELERCRRYQHSVALIMLDLDRFKDYNDRHGHPAGDEVLREVVELIRRNLRAVDVVARYGGDEFSILLPEAEAGQARQVAEKIHAAIAAHAFPHGRLTASLGLITCQMTKDLAADYLISLADHALYTAKHRGRNRLVSLRVREAGLCLAQNDILP